jgi:hypothetical protein
VEFLPVVAFYVGVVEKASREGGGGADDVELTGVVHEGGGEDIVDEFPDIVSEGLSLVDVH